MYYSRGLLVPETNKPQYRHSFFVETTVHWNKLPDGVVQTKPLEAFKAALLNHRQ